MHFMIIQDGFPKVLDATHYATDAHITPPNSNNWGYVDPTCQESDCPPIPYDTQVIAALDAGGAGRFHQLVKPPRWLPHTAGKLFSPMHAGLRPIPTDDTGVNNCPQAHDSPLVNGKTEASLRDSYSDNLHSPKYGGPKSGCPNQWAVREGYRGQVIGFQTTNSLGKHRLMPPRPNKVSPAVSLLNPVIPAEDDLSATLWNGTLNSNMVFLEAYEDVLWHARQKRLAGEPYLSSSVFGYADVPDRQKSLAHWSAELHTRRRTIADANPGHPHLGDPYPTSYSFTFKKDLAPSSQQTIHFVYPAARCAANTRSYGTIIVHGK